MAMWVKKLILKTFYYEFLLSNYILKQVHRFLHFDVIFSAVQPDLIFESGKTRDRKRKIVLSVGDNSKLQPFL